MEVSGRQAEGPEDVRKLVEDQEGVGRGQEGPEEVGKAVGEGGRSGRTWESNGTLQHGLDVLLVPKLSLRNLSIGLGIWFAMFLSGRESFYVG